MNNNDINIILEKFRYCNTYEFNDYGLHDKGIVSYYFHNTEEFVILIYEENNTVYQLDKDCSIIGIELINLDNFKIRFKSITGEDF